MQFLNKPTFRIYHSVNPDGPLIGNKSVSKLNPCNYNARPG